MTIANTPSFEIIASDNIISDSTVMGVVYPTSSSIPGTLYNGVINNAPPGGELVIQRPGKPPIKVAETLETIMERFCILQPNFEKMEQYPALKAAYDNYKMIEALIANDESK